jgi:hypothetical protein
VLGLASLLSTQYLARDALGPVLEACAGGGGGGRPPPSDGAGSGAAGGFLDALRDIATRPRHQAELASRGYRPYVPVLGGAAACIRTQLLYKVVAAEDADDASTSSSSSSPSAQQLLGWMALLVNASAVLPLVALVLVESDKARRGRRRRGGGGNGGFGSASCLAGSAPLVLLASHLWGASFAVLFLWLPAHLISAGGDDGGAAGAGSVPAAKGTRGAATVVAGLALVASGPALLLWVPPLASGWGWVAAGLAGPAAALVPLAAVNLLRPAASLFARAAGPRPPGGAPPPSAPSSPPGGGGGAVRAYGAAGALSLCLWTAAVFLAFVGYGVDYRGLAADAAGTGGGDGDPRGPLVRYLLADAAGAYAAALLFLASRSVPACLEAALLHAFVFGPGAAASMMLAQLEGQQQQMQRGAVPLRAAAASPARKKES